MNKEAVKKYFSKNDTVYKWWNPHDSDKKEVYLRQEKEFTYLSKDYSSWDSFMNTFFGYNSRPIF